MVFANGKIASAGWYTNPTSQKVSVVVDVTIDDGARVTGFFPWSRTVITGESRWAGKPAYARITDMAKSVRPESVTASGLEPRALVGAEVSVSIDETDERGPRLVGFSPVRAGELRAFPE